MKESYSSKFETYNAEVQARWSKTEAYKEYLQKVKGYSADKQKLLISGMDCIMKKFSACMKNGCSAESDEAQLLVKELKQYITDSFYTCSNEILMGLGNMYTQDERFKNNIDKHSEGTAEFIKNAIINFSSKQHLTKKHI